MRKYQKPKILEEKFKVSLYTSMDRFYDSFDNLGKVYLAQDFEASCGSGGPCGGCITPDPFCWW
ncbi:hypothetical protein FJY90_01190 [Candidatus Gottesmanbacteria bacterium]|nr:hypothetical protein [Candidatus Gottesmanbacteria bacterium]